MTTYYVGTSGSDGNAGTSWATRKLTLNGAENVPVVAGDIVYVGAGTYRESLTVDVSGTSGSGVITYIGDYSGSSTDGVGGVVRITGSADDIALTRASGITGGGKNYRTFQGFSLDGCSSYLIDAVTCGNWIIDKCILYGVATYSIMFNGTGANNTVQNCVSYAAGTNGALVAFSHSGLLSDKGHLVQNCIAIGGTYGVISVRVGGIVVKNSTFFGGGTTAAIYNPLAFTAGQTITVTNSIFHGCYVGVKAINVGEIIEDYCNFFACATNRTNVTAGAHSTANNTLFDSRWFFEMVK